MALSDDDLLDFDGDRLAAYDPVRSEELLAGEHRDAFRAQLVAAMFVEGWISRIREDDWAGLHPEGYYDGFKAALREMAAHFRQGNLVPGGVLHDETDAGGPGSLQRDVDDDLFTEEPARPQSRDW